MYATLSPADICSPVHSFVSHPLNFLLIDPKGCEADGEPGCAHKNLLSLARCLRSVGYVYVARGGQKAVEDDEFGIRYLPLRPDALPAFGALESVVVLDDAEIFEIVRQKYVEAEVHLLQTPIAPVSAEAAALSLVRDSSGEVVRARGQLRAA